MSDEQREIFEEAFLKTLNPEFEREVEIEFIIEPLVLKLIDAPEQVPSPSVKARKGNYLVEPMALLAAKREDGTIELLGYPEALELLGNTGPAKTDEPPPDTSSGTLDTTEDVRPWHEYYHKWERPDRAETSPEEPSPIAPMESIPDKNIDAPNTIEDARSWANYHERQRSDEANKDWSPFDR